MSEILVLQNVFKRFNDKYVIDDVSFGLPPGHILSLLGPSGCGKTTALRCIAGLERPTSGRILIGGKPVVDDGVFVPPERRGIGMVFQSYAVWPHLTVFDNVAFGLKVRKLPKAEIGDRVSRVLDLVGLGGLERRFAHQLSGGQQQRVALARSVVFEPKILLFDEPLSNLDAKLREHMRYELRELLKRLGTTAVYVTHDQAEAMVVSDTIILMQDGRICQSGRGQDLYEKPASRFVADFTGAANFIEASVVGPEAGTNRVRLATTDNLTLFADLPEVPPAGERVTLVVRPERISITDTPNGSTNSWPAELVQQVYLGREYEVVINLGNQTLRALVPRLVPPSPYVSIEPSDLIVLRGHEPSTNPCDVARPGIENR